MKIGIIGAMDEEIRVLKEKMTDVHAWTQAGNDFLQGTLGNHEVVVVKSGIGKVMSAMTTTLLIHHYGVQAVINTGSAGGIGEGLQVGDIVISEKVAYFDVDVTGFGYEKGQLPEQPLYFEASKYLLLAMEEAAQKTGQQVKRGLIVTGDSFVDAPSKVATIKKDFPEALAVEMEGASIAQAAEQFNVAFLVIRAMSDTADHQATQSFDDFIVEAGKKSAEMVIEFLNTVK
ncbi:MAG: 5'-methylthioadenosine/adenosylhomocysteine nucleosidase [Lactobacillales bacterium]|jgi:adenosylhomocysteine nucleosidase|nr:5'-methylthioadenosine/adenosylhomocysteine nucleosidase [Lactobacillales bacterium]